jgi:hypothetical protein
MADNCFPPSAICHRPYIAIGPRLGGSSSVEGFSSGSPAARRIALSAGRFVSRVF